MLCFIGIGCGLVKQIVFKKLKYLSVKQISLKDFDPLKLKLKIEEK